MRSARVRVANRMGLHARPAAEFVALANTFESDVTIGRPDDLRFVDAKSIVLVLSLDLSQGDVMEIVTEGPDEDEAARNLVALVERGIQIE